MLKPKKVIESHYDFMEILSFKNTEGGAENDFQEWVSCLAMLAKWLRDNS